MPSQHPDIDDDRPEHAPTGPAPAGLTVPKQLDPPMVAIALGGTAAWTVIGLVLLVADGPTSWRWICLAGAVLGLFSLVVMVPHDRRRRARAQTGSDSTSPSS